MTSFESSTFRAMGTEIEVLGAPTLAGGSFAAVRDLITCIESQFSRFRSDSELCALNAHAGRTFRATPRFAAVMREALQAARDTGGLFDPTILASLEAAGYDRDFTPSMCAPLAPKADASPCATFRAIEISSRGDIRLPQGCGVDLGGFVKGWAVDEAGRLLAQENWCINAGGDLSASGPGPEGDGWIVGVEDPYRPDRDAAAIRVRDAAVATSSTARRQWSNGHSTAHHLIDPRTGRPSETDLASVTVMSARTADADVLGKQLILLGSQGGLAHGEARGIPALFIDRFGAITSTSRMNEYVIG